MRQSTIWGGLRAEAAVSGAVARLSFRRVLTYLQAALWGLVTNAFFGVLRAAVMLALFGSRRQVAGLTAQAAITYTALTQLLIAALSLFGWNDLMRTIHRGEVTNDLLRPYRFLLLWSAQDAGRSAGRASNCCCAACPHRAAVLAAVAAELAGGRAGLAARTEEA